MSLLIAGAAASPAGWSPKTEAGRKAGLAAASGQTLASQINIPHTDFTLPNGLRVIVHPDHKAPVVAVAIWYAIGSKDEPPGRTGFAHLFEHLMFGGSESSDQSWFTSMQNIGATEVNGSTSFDRTHYFETVPRAALETALFLESDRMGWLLGAVTQKKLDTQRGVVQNEKRQSDNQPFGLVGYHELGALFPQGHPYHHGTIGSMADLDAAPLQAVHEWFRSHYGPNNAVLVLAGDVTPTEARTLAMRYFGHLPRGPQNHPAEAPLPTLPHRINETMHDRVASTRLYREWVVPGLLDPAVVQLEVAAGVLGRLSSSRLDDALVRSEQSAVDVDAGVNRFHRVSLLTVTVDVKPGADVDQVSRRLDQIVEDFVRTGPTADEVQRYVTSAVAERLRGFEQVSGKSAALAEGALYAGNPDFYRYRLQRLAAVTPSAVRAAMQRWLTRPVFALRVDPGQREPYQEAANLRRESQSSQQASVPPLAAKQPARTSRIDRPPAPAVGGYADVRFPRIEHARLSNGIPVTFARRTAVPLIRVAVRFDAGYAADSPERSGLQSLMATLLMEGTTTSDSRQIAEQLERLGAQLTATAGIDRTSVSLAALRSNLGPSLDLMADIIKNPAFAPAEVERLRGQRLAQIGLEMTDPQPMARRTLPALIYGQNYPYARPFTGSGTLESVRALTREEIVAAHRGWIRPETAQIFVAGDTSLAEIVPMLEQRFGRWPPPPSQRGTKDFSAPIPETRSRIVLIDRPQSPQSVIFGGEVLQASGTDDLDTLVQASDVLGGSFGSRLNTDLRETRHWSYGAGSTLARLEHRVLYAVVAPVQADHTGEALAAIRQDLAMFLTSKGVTSAELERTIKGVIRGLPGSFETSAQVMNALQQNALYRRPDNYYDTLASRLRDMTAADLDAAARRMIHPDNFVWVVVGDASQIRKQLEPLGLPIDVISANPSAARAQVLPANRP